MSDYEYIISNQNNHLALQLKKEMSIPIYVIDGERSLHKRSNPEIQSEINNKKILLLFFFDNAVNLQDQLFNLLVLIESVDSAAEVNLFCPYIPYSRTDERTFSFLESVFAPWPVNKLITFESHAVRHYINADFFQNISMAPWVTEHMTRKVMPRYSHSNWVIVAPDQGAWKLAQSVASRLNLLAIDLIKLKSKSSLCFEKKNELLIAGDVSFCIVDDLADSGATLNGAAKLLRDEYSNTKNIVAYVAHSVGKYKGNKTIELHTARYKNEHNSQAVNACSSLCSAIMNKTSSALSLGFHQTKII